MKHLITIGLLLFASINGFSQINNPHVRNLNQGKLYFYWGWNWSGYTKSNLHFTGDDYDFTIKKVVARDRQTPFSLNTYFSPAKFTIPQYNFRIGYYFNDRWDISFGADHMKYVMLQDQMVDIEGYIRNTNPAYDNTYSDQSIKLTKDFLRFEHTDGLNYVNAELRHSDDFLNLKKVDFTFVEGLGIGFLYPRTSSTLLGKPIHDEFHLAGYGTAGLVGLKISFFDHLFLQSELKGGFINMPDVRTTFSIADKAKHNFFFSQFNIVFGGSINTKSKSAKD